MKKGFSVGAVVCGGESPEEWLGGEEEGEGEGKRTISEREKEGCSGGGCVVVEGRIWCGGCIDRSGGAGRKRLRSSSSSSLLLEFIFLRKCVRRRRRRKCNKQFYFVYQISICVCFVVFKKYFMFLTLSLSFVGRETHSLLSHLSTL